MSNLKFTQTIYNGKKGVLPPPDADGYHTLIVGALNCFNKSNEYYVGEGVIEAFNQSSLFQERVRSGSLYAEVGHPVREAGMSFTDYYARVLNIRETNICGHFSEVWLDMSYGQKHKELNNPDMIAIYAKVKPCGIHAKVLQTSLETPQQNTAFSVRGITDNRENNGRLERKLTTIVTFDHVYKPGISVACKANAPGLESDIVTVESLGDVEIMEEVLRDRLTTPVGVFAQESYGTIREEVLRGISQPHKARSLPKW